MIKRKIFQSIFMIALVMILGGTFTYAWLTNEISISKTIVIQNGMVDELEISLYRGYDYDLNGTLDVMNNNAASELDMYYMNITNVNNDDVEAIVEASIVTYRIVLTNNSNRKVIVKPYFYFSNTVLDNDLINNYMSLLFNLNEITVINNVDSVNEEIVTENLNKSLALYRDSQLIKEISIDPASTTYLDLKIKAANLTEMYNGLNEYLDYSQNSNYDLNKGLYTDSNGTIPVPSLTNGLETITLVNGMIDRYISLKEYKNEPASTVYTYDYLELAKVYSERQMPSQLDTPLALVIDKFCFDASYITGDDSTTILSSYSSIDLTNYYYIENDVHITKFYNSSGVLISGLYDLSNGLYDSSNNKIYFIYDATYKHTLIYEELKIVKILKEAI